MAEGGLLNRTENQPFGTLERWRTTALVLVPLHLTLTAFTTGTRPEHIALDGLLATLVLIGPRARTLSFVLFPFWMGGIVIDSVRFLTPYRATVHVADVYAAETGLFGIHTSTGTISVPEWFATHTTAALDLFCGLAYVLYLFAPIVFALVRSLQGDARRASRVAWAFFIVNLIGVSTWLLWPAAPPWYVQIYGLGPAVLNAPASVAGTGRFDELLGIHLFSSFYSRNPNIFGAMPSLHVSYPTLVACAAWRLGGRWRAGSLAFVGWVAFSAVYLRHHWVIDVLAGAIYGCAAYGLVSLVASWVPRRLQLRSILVQRSTP